MEHAHALDEDGWQISRPLHLPFGASFIHANRETMVPFYEGPLRQSNVTYFEGFVCSQGFVIVGDEASSNYILIGALTAHRSLTYFFVHIDQKCLRSVTIRQPSIRSGDASEELITLEGSSWKDLLIEYANKVRSLHGYSASRDSDDVVRGYCSWYYSYHNVTEMEFLENLSSLENRSDIFAPQFVQIDDGYQAHHGDWLETNSQWPSGLKSVAAQITGKGFQPGIWLMPLLASTDSRLYKSRPEWFVKGFDNTPLEIPGWSPPPEDRWVCLDITKQIVKDHIENLFTTLYDWGFRYFKLDGLGLSYPEGRREDQRESGISALRTALQIVRRSVKDSCILSCGAPYLSAIGLCDNARASADTGIYWRARGIPGEGPRGNGDADYLDPTIPCLYNAITQSLEKWWMFDTWFRVDPDVVIVRCDRSHLTIGEARISCLAAIITGTVFTSDRVSQLAPERASLLKRSSELRMAQARPWHPPGGQSTALTCFEGKVGNSKAYAVFNLSSADEHCNLSQFSHSESKHELLNDSPLIHDQITIKAHDAALIICP